MRPVTSGKLTAMAAIAALATSASADEQAVRATLATVSPQTPIEAVAETPSIVLFEAAVDGRAYYITSDGRYILGGPPIDTKPHIDLTAARPEQVNAIAWAIWCANGRGRAWDEALHRGVAQVEAANCETPIATLAAFARQHRISRTPTIILSDGRRVVGAVPKAELEQQMLRAAKAN